MADSSQPLRILSTRAFVERLCPDRASEDLEHVTIAALDLDSLGLSEFALRAEELGITWSGHSGQVELTFGALYSEYVSRQVAGQ